jgi:hypothetical protein
MWGKKGKKQKKIQNKNNEQTKNTKQKNNNKKKSMLRGESSTTFPATFRISVNWHYKIRPLFLPKTTITIIKTCLI